MRLYSIFPDELRKEYYENTISLLHLRLVLLHRYAYTTINLKLGETQKYFNGTFTDMMKFVSIECE